MDDFIRDERKKSLIEDEKGELRAVEQAEMLPGVEAMKTRGKQSVIGPIELGFQKPGTTYAVLAAVFFIAFVILAVFFLTGIGGGFNDYPPALVFGCLGGAVLAAAATVFWHVKFKRNGGANSFFKLGFFTLPELGREERKALALQNFDLEKNHMNAYIVACENEMDHLKHRGIVGIGLTALAIAVGSLLPKDTVEEMGYLFLCMAAAVVGIVWIWEWRINTDSLFSVYFFRKLGRRSLYEKLISEEAKIQQLEEAEKAYNAEEARKKDDSRKLSKEQVKRRVTNLRVDRGMSLEEAEKKAREEELLESDIDTQLAAMLEELKHPKPPEEPPKDNDGNPPDTDGGNPQDAAEGYFDENVPDDDTPEAVWTVKDEDIKTDGNKDEDWEYWEKYYHK